MSQAHQIQEGRMPAEVKTLADKLAVSKVEYWNGHETHYTFADGSTIRLIMPS